MTRSRWAARTSGCARWPSPGRGYGARRHAAVDALAEAVGRVPDARPRAVIAAGPDSRLLRAVLEPWCPVPFVAWPSAGLPGWAGSLDLVVVLAPDGSDTGTASAVAEAARRGCQVVVACPTESIVGDARRRALDHDPADRDRRPARDRGRDALASCTRSRSARPPTPTAVAEALDDVAISCSPQRDISINPAKMLAISLADAAPGGLGRVRARGPCRATGRRADPPYLRPHRGRRRRRAPAAGDRGVATPQRLRRPLRRRQQRERAAPGPHRARRRRRRPGRPGAARPARGRARAGEVRVEAVTTEADGEVARYASLLLSGTYAAEYLRLGLVED